MKTNSYFFKNFLVFLFFIFTSITFGQSNNCAATPTLTIGTICTTTNYNVANTFTDSGVAESCTGTSWRDGWYTFTTGASTTLITINGTSDKRLGLALYTGACGSLSEVICTTPGTANANISNQIVLPNTTYRLRLMRTNNDNNNDMTGTICVIDTTPAACTGTPTAGTTTVSPTSGAAGSSYTISNTGHTTGSGITYQWQSNTNGAGWVNIGASSSTYSNTTATAPASGTVIWRLRVLCTASTLSSTSTTATFTVAASQNIPASGNTTVSCGSNVTLLDNGGSGDYANSSNGYTVLEAGLGATINIAGNYITESGLDLIRIYSGTGTAGTLLATYSGTGAINYTGTAGQTLTIQFSSDSSIVYSGFSLAVTYSGTCFPVCSGAPTGGTISVTPANGGPGSSYTVSATGVTLGSGMTYQWQSNTNGAGWVNAGASSGTYSNYSATAPGTIGSTVAWQLFVTCTNSGQSATSTNSTFTVVSTLNVPTSGSNNVVCGTNVTLYDNGGAGGDYASNSSGYTVLEAGLGATINISGSYATEGSTIDYIRIFNGTGTGGTILATYSGTGTINYTGTAGQTLTVQFHSDGSIVNTGFNLSVTYTGVCFPACSGTPTGGTVTTSPNTSWPGSPYTVTATGYTQALNLTYQWQNSTDGITFSNV